VVPAGPARPGQLADELRAACEAALPRPQRPAAFHLVRELPLGATGKVARARLRELASAQPDASTRGRAASAGGAPTASATTARATATAAYRSGA
jgi:acyl-CoA synthetase (AMP-forming)/AMP-acid ligase II